MDIWTSFFKSNDFIPLIKEPLLILDGKRKKYGSLNSLGKLHLSFMFYYHICPPWLNQMCITLENL